MLLEENYRLRIRYFEATPATGVSAREHIVDPDEVIPGLLKPRTVLLVCSARRLRLPGALQPPDIVFGPFATVRTAIGRLFYFFFLVKKITFVHKLFSPSLRFLALT